MIIKPQKYDGHILHQRFAFRYFGNKVSSLGNIIAFRGEMEVLADAMLDQEGCTCRCIYSQRRCYQFSLGNANNRQQCFCGSCLPVFI